MPATDEDLAERANARIGVLLKGKYTLDRVLGSGGMATVYSATHRNGKEFAIKVLHADLSMRTDTRTRFLREGYLANRVNHPGAVAVLDDDIAEDGAAFLVMELIHGTTIEALWERQGGRLPWALVAGIGLQLLEVLTAAHARGLVHRDIKPGNLMLTSDGQVKVLDFGIARLRDMTGGQTTQTGMVMGTPAFMAPEHAMAKTDEIDAQTDVWAAGATMFTLATGRLVHDADNAQQLLIKAATKQARPVAALTPTMPRGLGEVIDRALAFDKSKRWPSATAMQAALREAAREAFQTVPVACVLADMLADLRQRERALLGPTEPPVRPKPIVDSDEIPTRLRSVAALSEAGAETQIGSENPRTPPPIGVITAAALATDSSMRRTLSRPRGLAAAGAGLAAVGIGAALLVVLRAAPSKEATTAAGAASRSTAVRVQLSAPSVTVPSRADEWRPVATTPPAAIAAPAAPIPVAPSPHGGPAAPRVRPVPSAAPPAAAPPPEKVDCNPPYEFDESGNKRWKRECL
jgi:eukaryotic-like serine/threonine-protein kinase